VGQLLYAATTSSLQRALPAVSRRSRPNSPPASPPLPRGGVRAAGPAPFRDRAWRGGPVRRRHAIDLYTGRLALAFGALPALGAVAALDRDRVGPAALAIVSALCSPVAALFAAIAAAAYALGG